jgi:hypothetical protein
MPMHGCGASTLPQPMQRQPAMRSVVRLPQHPQQSFFVGGRARGDGEVDHDGPVFRGAVFHDQGIAKRSCNCARSGSGSWSLTKRIVSPGVSASSAP